MPSYSPTFKNQSALAEYCRTGNWPEIKGIKKENLPEYRRLVYNVIDDTLKSAYPLTQNLLLEEEWDELVQSFFSNHPCQSPQIWSMPKEFFYYVESALPPISRKYPFLLELIWFEWLEIELYMMEDIIIEFEPQGDISKDLLVINPENYLERFTYPVHLKNAKTISEIDKKDYFLILHRQPSTGKVVFTDVSTAFVRMLEMLDESALDLKTLISTTCAELGLSPSQEILDLTTEFFTNGLKTGLILGFRRNI